MSRWPLTPRGTGAALLAVACYIVAQTFAIDELLYVSVLLGVVVVASIATLYLVRRTEKVSRTFSPDVGTVGEEVAVRLHVEIRSPLPGAQGRWSDALPDGVSGVDDQGRDGATSGVFPETASGLGSTGAAVELAYRATAWRRGIRSLGPLSVTTTDPFGFARRRHTIGTAVPLTVAPALVDLAPLAEQAGDAGGSTHTTTDQLGQGADNLIPRHYLPGDSMRRIHWRASAHRDELMVRQEEQESTPEACVVLDRGRARWDADAARAAGADPGFEAAVSACVSAAARLVQEGYLVSVLDADGTLLAEPLEGGDAAAALELAIDFATVTARHDRHDDTLMGIFSDASTGPLVYVTGTLTMADAEALAPLTRHSTLPVLLAVAPHEDALARSAAAGWRVAAIPPDADLAAAWAAAVERGARRVVA